MTGVEEADEFGSGGAQACRCIVKREVEDEKKKGENGKVVGPYLQGKGQ